MRVYIPATLPLLAGIAAAGEVGAAYVAYAVTPAIREWYTNADLDELEYAAMSHAARSSLRKLADDPSSPPRRVVISADVSDTAVQPMSNPGDAGERGAVLLVEATPVRRFASVHVDGADARADVRAALGALAATVRESGAATASLAMATDEDTQFKLDSVEDHELLWYATQEIPDLLRLS
jgi:predicted short-subunit dehydrogenase-like oxidoreductase (DUF2520 family)